MNRPARHLALLAAAAALLAVAGAPANSSAQPSAGQLQNQIAAQRARQHSLSAGVQSTSTVINALQRSVNLVAARLAAVQAELATARAALSTDRAQLGREQTLAAVLAARLQRARTGLSRELRSTYETDPPDLVSVVLDSHGIADLLQRLDYLRYARSYRERLITGTRLAKVSADGAATRLAALEARDRQTTIGASARAAAVSAMSGLLSARDAALRSARAAELAALHNSRARGAQLNRVLTRIEAQAGTAFTGSGLGATAGWAIPYVIVLCESGGQNLPPNGAGASGYYQFMPATWKALGGVEPAAYLAPKSEQDRLAAKLWNGGSGASNWTCAGMVGH